jgi:hypothetical protein
MLNYKIAILACLLVCNMITLASCNSSKNASKENLAKAINGHINYHKQCLKYNYPQQFKSDARDRTLMVAGNASEGFALTEDDLKMNFALEKVGLLKSNNFDYIPKEFLMTSYTVSKSEYKKRGLPMYTGKEFSLTNKGRQYQLSNQLSMICYADGNEVTEIIMFTEPAESNGVKVIKVRYNFKDRNIRGWVQDESVAAALIKYKEKHVTQSSNFFSDEIKMTLTNQGWVVWE